MTVARYYVYLHIRESDSRIFYVGKGTRYRAWARHGRSKYWENIALKSSYKVVIVAHHLFEYEALLLEKRLIQSYQETLCNLTSGGDSPVFSEDTRKKMSAVRKGKPKTVEHKQKISAAHLGKTRPEMVGSLHPNADNNRYTFHNNKEGLYFTGTRRDFCLQFDLSLSGLRTLFSKIPSKQYKGWTLSKETK